MICRHQVDPRQRLRALSVGLFCMRVIDAYIPATRSKVSIAAEVRAEALLFLRHQWRRCYESSVILHDVPAADGFALLMDRGAPSKREARTIIDYWHSVQKRALYYTIRDVPPPRWERKTEAAKDTQ